MGHSRLRLGKVQANLDQLVTLNSSLLTAVGIQDGPATSESKHLLSFLKFSTVHALFTVLLTERRSSSSAPRRGSAEPRPRGCSGLGEPHPALPSF